MVGLIKGLAADAAGLQQGDQLLELDGQRLQGQSPFAVASLLQGQDQAEDGQGLGESATLRLKVGAQPGPALPALCACCSLVTVGGLAGRVFEGNS